MYLGLHYSLCSGKKENVPFMMQHEGLPVDTIRFPQRVAELLFKIDQQYNSSYKNRLVLCIFFYFKQLYKQYHRQYLIFGYLNFFWLLTYGNNR